MKKIVKIVIAIVLTLAVTAGLIVFIIPDTVTAEAVTADELSWAKE